MSVCLYGELGVSGDISLHGTLNRAPFAHPGGVAAFEVALPPLGPIGRLRLSHDGAFEDCKWHVRAVEVKLLATGACYGFDVNQWLGPTIGRQGGCVSLSPDRVWTEGANDDDPCAAFDARSHTLPPTPLLSDGLGGAAGNWRGRKGGRDGGRRGGRRGGGRGRPGFEEAGDAAMASTCNRSNGAITNRPRAGAAITARYLASAAEGVAATAACASQREWSASQTTFRPSQQLHQPPMPPPAQFPPSVDASAMAAACMGLPPPTMLPPPPGQFFQPTPSYSQAACCFPCHQPAAFPGMGLGAQGNIDMSSQDMCRGGWRPRLRGTMECRAAWMQGTWSRFLAHGPTADDASAPGVAPSLPPPLRAEPLPTLHETPEPTAMRAMQTQDDEVAGAPAEEQPTIVPLAQLQEPAIGRWEDSGAAAQAGCHPTALPPNVQPPLHQQLPPRQLSSCMGDAAAMPVGWPGLDSDSETQASPEIKQHVGAAPL